MSRRIVGLDIGTCFIRTVIAEIDSEGNIEVIGLSKKPSQGVRNGVIVNIDATKEAVKQSIEEAEQMAGVEVVELNTELLSKLFENADGLTAEELQNKIKKIFQ